MLTPSAVAAAPLRRVEVPVGEPEHLDGGGLPGAVGAGHTDADRDRLPARQRSPRGGPDGPAQAVEAVEARYEGDDITAAFNPNYLADGLAAASGESVRLEVRDGLKPGIVRGDSDEFTYLVMPVRLPTPVG